MNISFELNWRLVLRWLIGAVLVWAALGKLANIQEFYASLLAYRLPFPGIMLKAIATVLPWLELLCGLLLLANIRTTSALTWALVLFTVFTVCTGQAWMRGLPISCGCLDLRLVGIAPGSELAGFLESVGFAFVRAILLTGAAFLLVCHAVKQPSVTPQSAS